MRTITIINGNHKTIQNSIMKPKRHTRPKRSTRKNMLLKNKIKQTVIILTKMIKIITCDIRTMYVPWMHTYQRLK